jgi:hypothetical protein
MKALILTNNKFTTKDITNKLEDLQAIVEGYIEIPYLSEALNENGIDVIINEEGKLIDGLKPEIAIIDKETMEILDIVYGNCIFMSHDDEGETIELNKEQIAIVKHELRTDVVLTYHDTNIQIIVKALFI